MTVSPNSPRASDRLRPVLDWLREEGPALIGIDSLFQSVCARLEAARFPFDRVSLNLEVLHPEVSGEAREWRRGGDVRKSQASRDVILSDDYLKSPVKIVDDTDRPFRCRLDGAERGMPLLERLRSEGFTDYTVNPLAFADTDRTACMSFATKRAGGFDEEELEEVACLVHALSSFMEARVMRHLARDLLATYLGAGPGERVLRGQIRRGDVDTIFAALWFCDLRGFTHFTHEHTHAQTVARLNAWFDLAVEAVEANGGEVLKFMGDGLLAIFPAEEINPREACGRALSAAKVLDSTVAGWNEAQANRHPPIDYGLALHLGYVAFGNIGGARRLDFTVIGAAVNLASRLQDMAKHLDRRVVVSEAFAGCSGRRFEELGHHELRGIPQPVAVFAPV